MPCLRAPRLARAFLTLALAYAIALSGMLGGLKATAHAAEARLAAQLGVICTIHGMVEAGSDELPERPAAGKLACIEHCLMGGAGYLPLLADEPNDLVVWPQTSAAAIVPVLARASTVSPAQPPPPRGPPALSI